MSPFTKNADGTMVYQGQVYSRTVLPSIVSDKKGHKGPKMENDLMRKARKYSKMTDEQLADRATTDVLKRKKTAILEKLGKSSVGAKIKKEHPGSFIAKDVEVQNEVDRMKKLVEQYDQMCMLNDLD